MAFIGKLLEKRADDVYVVFRVGAGLLFLLLGIQKIFGLWGMPGGPAVFLDLIWFAGILEIKIGLALVLGVFVRLASLFGAAMMVFAYYLGHVMPTGSWNPAENFGVSALIFGLAFLVTAVHGARKLSLETMALKKEIF